MQILQSEEVFIYLILNYYYYFLLFLDIKPSILDLFVQKFYNLDLLIIILIYLLCIRKPLLNLEYLLNRLYIFLVQAFHHNLQFLKVT